MIGYVAVGSGAAGATGCVAAEEVGSTAVAAGYGRSGVDDALVDEEAGPAVDQVGVPAYCRLSQDSQMSFAGYNSRKDSRTPPVGCRARPSARSAGEEDPPALSDGAVTSSRWARAGCKDIKVAPCERMAALRYA